MKNLTLLILISSVFIIYSCQEKAPELAPPEIIDFYAVKPDILAIRVKSNHVVHGKQIPYVPHKGDSVDRSSRHRWVLRQGKYIGLLVGRDEKILYTVPEVSGMGLDTSFTLNVSNYVVLSSDDQNYINGGSPDKVYCKSKPTDMVLLQPDVFAPEMVHVVYLQLPYPLTQNSHYTIKLNGGHFEPLKFQFDAKNLPTEAIHMNQIGFHPDDPEKIAFLSCWKGNGGGTSYADMKKFIVIENHSHEKVFEGDIVLSKSKDDSEGDDFNTNYNLTDVYEMHFPELKTTGEYKIVIKGLGCSNTFLIHDTIWKDAFRISARGMYHHRSGIELGEPYTTFKRPRCFHPDDGVKVYSSTAPLMNTGNGLNHKDTNFGNLVNGKTEDTLANCWGAHMDAGDWDRRITHLTLARSMVDLANYNHDYFKNVNLNIPESNNNLPDIIDEALFDIDGYKRLQTPEGGIRGGIESSEHPVHGETSWQESLDAIAYAPGIYSSYFYAGVVAYTAMYLEKHYPDIAPNYKQSAIKAMEWAETEYVENEWEEYSGVIDLYRGLAAIEFYRLTGDGKWHDIFKQMIAVHKGIAAIKHVGHWGTEAYKTALWQYHTADPKLTNTEIKEKCRQIIIEDADLLVESGGNTAFHFVKYPDKIVGTGNFALPMIKSIIWAYQITGKSKYLHAILLSSQCGAGANPDNLCYTTGVGSHYPQHPLHVDSRITCQAPPEGITVFGPVDIHHRKAKWGGWGHRLVNQFTFPKADNWPIAESYWDVFWYPVVCEYTIQQSISKNAYAWGFICAMQNDYKSPK